MTAGMEREGTVSDGRVCEDASAGIYLRFMTRDDTGLIVRWRNSEPVRKNFIYQALFTVQSHENWIRTMVDTGRVIQMMICDMASDKPLGSVYIRDIDRQHNKAEYGIFIGEEQARGRGVGTAAARLMLCYCFEEQGLHRVFLRVFADNRQAIRSYEKAGFRREGLLRDDVCIEGKYRDILWMAAVRPEKADEQGTTGGDTKYPAEVQI
jgi:UDP-4-amino-4,6-dideoxy-N-acetyl-beta-L-altrosamine N-acetyltransferase